MGIVFKIPAAVLLLLAGTWSLFVSFGIVEDKFGFVGGVIAFVLGPAALIFVPLYEALANGNWYPFILSYVFFLLALLIYGIGAFIDGEW